MFLTNLGKLLRDCCYTASSLFTDSNDQYGNLSFWLLSTPLNNNKPAKHFCQLFCMCIKRVLFPRKNAGRTSKSYVVSETATNSRVPKGRRSISDPRPL
jgi:hypothetical protein